MTWTNPQRIDEIRAAVAMEMFRHEVNEVGFLDIVRAEHAPLIKRDVAVSIMFIEMFCESTATRNGQHSYAIKHAAERFAQQAGLGFYIGNGALLCAALYLGVKVGRRIGPNAILGLRVIPEDAWFQHQSQQEFELKAFT